MKKYNGHGKVHVLFHWGTAFGLTTHEAGVVKETRRLPHVGVNRVTAGSACPGPGWR